MGGGIFANPDARHPFASEGRTYSKGILLEGKHGFGPKSSRTKLTEKPELESSGRQFCRLGKKLSFRQEKLLFRQEFGAVRGRPALQNGAVFALQFAPVGGEDPLAGLEHAGEMAGRDEACGLGDFGDVEPGGAGASQ